MTVESSIKLLLIFSRRFRSAMMWSGAYDADDAAPWLLREALPVGGGDPWPWWAGSGKLRGGGAAASSTTMPPLPAGCAEPVTKFQLTNGRLLVLPLGGGARLNELGDCGQEPWPSLAAAGARSLLKNDLQECFDFF